MDSPRDGHSPKADKAQEAFGQGSDESQLSRFYGSVFLCLWEEPGFAFLVSSGIFPSQSAQTAGSTRAAGNGLFCGTDLLTRHPPICLVVPCNIILPLLSLLPFT